jgi:hypothetical protein
VKDMLAIPENVLARFNEVLKQRAVQESFQVYYRKWLRYFLDFCEKYPPPETKSEQEKVSGRCKRFHLAMVFSTKGTDPDTRNKRV